MGGTDTWATMLDWFTVGGETQISIRCAIIRRYLQQLMWKDCINVLRDRKFAQVVANHFWSDLNLIEFFSGVYANN